MAKIGSLAGKINRHKAQQQGSNSGKAVYCSIALFHYYNC